MEMMYLSVQDVKPVISNLGYSCITRLQSSPLQESLEYWRLEDFDELQFTSAFDFKTLQLGQAAILIEYSISEQRKIMLISNKILY